MNKTMMYWYSTQCNNGQVFSFDIIDNESIEIQIACFNDFAELHYDRIEVGGLYTISKGTVKEANTKYNKLNNHMEITLAISLHTN